MNPLESLVYMFRLDKLLHHVKVMFIINMRLYHILRQKPVFISNLDFYFA